MLNIINVADLYYIPDLCYKIFNTVVVKLIWYPHRYDSLIIITWTAELNEH